MNCERLISGLTSVLELPIATRPECQEIEAAVLVLFAVENGECQLFFVRRSETLERHPGQIAFPGGHCEPEDYEAQGAVTAALREVEEEVGIPRENITVLGLLPPVSTRTGFHITPVVGVLRSGPGEQSLNLCSAEVAEAFWVPFAALRTPGTEFYVGGRRIWGATGAIVGSLVERLETVSFA